MLSTWASLWGNLSGLFSTFKGGDYQSGSPVSQPPPQDIVLFVNPSAWGLLGMTATQFLSSYSHVLRSQALLFPLRLPFFNSEITGNQTSGLRGKSRQAADNTAEKL